MAPSVGALSVESNPRIQLGKSIGGFSVSAIVLRRRASDPVALATTTPQRSPLRATFTRWSTARTLSPDLVEPDGLSARWSAVAGRDAGAAGRWGVASASSDRKIRGARVDSCCVASSRRPEPTSIRRVGCSVGRWIRGGGVGCRRSGAVDSAAPGMRSRVVSASDATGPDLVVRPCL